MARFRAPANIQLRRAQITLMLAALLPTVLIIAVGIVLLALGTDTPSIVSGVLVLAFCTTSLTGYILGSIFVSRGASLARFQNDFLSSVSHELRTPLTSVLMFLDTLRDERLTDPDEKRKCLDLLDQEVRRLEGLVTRLLSLSQIEAGQHRFERNPVAVDSVVEDALAAFDGATLTERVDVDLDVEGGLEVVGDRVALSLALTNLLVNAWKYGVAEEPSISLSARASGKHVEVVVSDHGPGIPRDEQSAIFEEFNRGRAAIDSKRKGSGLGLAIVRAIIRAHRGKIDLRSSPGRGAEFRIRIPRIVGGAAVS